MADLVMTLVASTGTLGRWRATNLFYGWTWMAGTRITGIVKSPERREGRSPSCTRPTVEPSGFTGSSATGRLWVAEMLESHVSYPMLALFRSRHLGQS